MTLLLEHPTPIIVAGSLAALVALMAFVSRRSGGALAALAVIAAITVALVIVERVVVTPREEVENAVASLLDAVEANDVDRVIAAIDPTAANVQADAKALMPQIKVEVANADDLDILVEPGANPPRARAAFQAYLRGTHVRSGAPVAYINQRVELTWIKRGDRWALADYAAYWQGQPINAVSSAAGNSPVPAR
jgi:hypothetical protein